MTMDRFYDDQYELVSLKITDQNGVCFTEEYQYDITHRLMKKKDIRGLITQFVYSVDGKLLFKKIYHTKSPSSFLYFPYDPEGENKRKKLEISKDRFFYTTDLLTEIRNNLFSYLFAYDEAGRMVGVSVGDDSVNQPLLQLSYDRFDPSRVSEILFASGEKDQIMGDREKNVESRFFIDREGVSHAVRDAVYDAVGKIVLLYDRLSDVYDTFDYDKQGNVVHVCRFTANDDKLIFEQKCIYDLAGYLKFKCYPTLGQIYQTLYEKDEKYNSYPDHRIFGINLEGRYTETAVQDDLGRRACKNLILTDSKTLFREVYRYLHAKDSSTVVETDRVIGVESTLYGTDANTLSMKYIYDRVGNVICVSYNDAIASRYYYDSQKRPIREDNYSAGKTFVWEYGRGENLCSKKVFDLSFDCILGECTRSASYVYCDEGWCDRLKSFNGKPCKYDLMGNPILYLGHHLEWDRVKYLSKFDNHTFQYNANGVRIRKNQTVYLVDGERILQETDGETVTTYFYGLNGVIGFHFNGMDYYYRKNLQGDVIEIYTAEGKRVASYTYDAKGKVLHVCDATDTCIGSRNPFRYRSYYYDTETGLYYHEKRYYDPEIGRFLNPDIDALLNPIDHSKSLNLYAFGEEIEKNIGGETAILTPEEERATMFYFSAGTPLLTASGQTLIEHVQIGESVICMDPATNKLCERPITQISRNKLEHLLELKLGEDIVWCTPNQPFSVKGRGMVCAAELVPEDLVYTKDQETVAVLHKCELNFDVPCEVFQLSVSDCHCFFIQSQSLMVGDADF